MSMSNPVHPAAPHHMPAFITAPGETDAFLVGTAVLLVVAVLFLGSLYFRLHSLPERIAHGTSKVQFQLVAVLALIALFTHQNVFWIAALLLALVPIPDFWTPLVSMADSLARMAGRRLRMVEVREASPPVATVADRAPASVPAALPAGNATAGEHQAEAPAAVAGDGEPPVITVPEKAAPRRRQRPAAGPAAPAERG